MNCFLFYRPLSLQHCCLVIILLVTENIFFKKKGTHRTYLYSVFFFGMFQVKFNHYVCLCTRLSRFSRHNAYTFLHQGESPDRDIRSLFCYKTDNCYTFVLIKDFYERKTFFTERIRAEIFAKMSVLRKVYCHDFVYDWNI